MKDFLSVVQSRRSIYEIGAASPISEACIRELAEEALLHTPSAFHMQSGRILLLFGSEHGRLWSIVLEALRKVVPATSFAPTEAKIESFAAGYGTVLFFDDTAVTHAFAKKYSPYRDKLPFFAQQSNGMLQFCVWNLLEVEGLGASLQHYNPLIDDAVRAAWDLPDTWLLTAQMPFGGIAGSPPEKQFAPLEKRILVKG